MISQEIYFVLLRLIKEQKSKVQKVRITNLWLFSTISLKPHTAHLFLRSLTNTMVSNIQLQNLQVLLAGLYDPESNLHKLRMPAVKSPLMKMIWDKVTEDWQVISRSTSHISFVIMF